MSSKRRPVVALIGLAGLLLAVAPHWHLWPSPFEGTQTPDIQQPQWEGRPQELVFPHRSVAQTFVPRRTPLVRIDFDFNNSRDPRPGRFKLWRWRGSYAQTLKSEPLFEDVIELAGPPGVRRLSLFPRVPVEVGQTYFFELSAPGRELFGVGFGRSAGGGPYPDGQVHAQGKPPSWGADGDIWFETFSTPAAAPPAALLAASRPGAWTSPPASSRSPTRDEYRRRIAEFAEHHRAGERSGCGRSLSENVLRHAFLYRLSCEEGRCDEEHAQAARGNFANAYAWRFCTARRTRRKQPCQPACDPDPKIAFNWLEHPAYAYLWTRDSPSLTRRDHDEIRVLLTDSARRHRETNIETGAHNRPLKSAIGLRLLTRLYPEHPDAAEWDAYADAVWAEFRSHRDSLENSASYEDRVFWPAVLSYAEAAGLEDELFADPDIRAWVGRTYARVAPNGSVPNHGHGFGWGRDNSGLVWLFEQAAARWQLPEYRWLAHRLYAFSRDRIRDDPPRDDGMAQGHPFLMRAYLHADETLEPQAPKPRRERAFAEIAEPWRAGPGAPGSHSFVAGAALLAGIELPVAEGGPGADATLRLWRFEESPDFTRVRPPLYASRPVAGAGDGVLRFEPLLALEEGASYTVELDSPAPIAFTGFRALTLEGRGSEVTTRPREARLTRQQARERGYIHSWVFGEGRAPGRLILRSGFEPEDMFALVNLMPLGGHGQPELGAFISLVDEDSTLLIDGPFPYRLHQNLPEDESIPMLRRYWGGRSREPGTESEVTHFRDGRNATAAWIEFDDPMGWGVRQERRIYFVKNRFVWVRDRFSFPDSMMASTGPVWHVGDIAAPRGKDWFDIYYREPLGNLWKLRNPERYALLYLVPRPGYRSEAFVQETLLPPKDCDPSASRVAGKCRHGPFYVVSQRHVGEARRGETRWFDTLLVPHGRELPAKRLAENVTLHRIDEAITALTLEIDGERWTVVDSPDRETVAADGIEVEARYALVRADPPYVFAAEATRVRVGPVSRSWPVPSDVEEGGTTPP